MSTSGETHSVFPETTLYLSVKGCCCHSLCMLGIVLTMLRTILIIGVVLSLTLSGCRTDAGGQSDDIQIVVTTTVLGDVVANVAGPDASVVILMPTGADPHDYQASARQVAALNQADIVFVNGLGLEAALEDVLESAAADGASILEVAPLLEPLPFGDGDSHDPHVWMDPARMAKAATIIAQSLTSLDDSVDWKSRADAYGTRLDATDKEIERILAAIPERDRKLVTNHDSLAYLADRYDFVVVGTVVPGGSTLGDPSSGELAQLVRVIEEEDVQALFGETTQPSALADALAAEVGGEIEVIELYTGSLGAPGSGADTLIGMLLTNARRIAEGLVG